jgi:solute carrier family 25 phosphate transporter 23/24/25/41
VLKVVPETAVKFAAFDALKQVVAVDPGNATTGERFVAGGVAGAAAQAAIYPLEIVKTRMALSSNAAHPKAAPTTITGVFRAVLNESGARGLFRGLAPSLVGIVPYAGIDLMTNSTLREYVTRRYQAAGAEPGIPELLGCGMASSTTAMLATYPLNVIRTRMQTGGMPGFPAYESASECFLDVVRREGGRGLYRGIAPSLAKVLPASSISYAVYDTLSAERR